jgi:hypothetical protein
MLQSQLMYASTLLYAAVAAIMVLMILLACCRVSAQCVRKYVFPLQALLFLAAFGTGLVLLVCSEFREFILLYSND